MTLACLLGVIWLGASAAQAEPIPSPFVLPPAPSTSTPHADFSSDHFEYFKSSGVIELQGHARIKESSWTLRSDRVLLYLEEKRAQAFGNVQLQDGVSLAFGDEGEFDFEKHSGNLTNAVAGFAPWRIQGAQGALSEGHRVDFKSADFTSCNLFPDPHYHFHASSVRVNPHHSLRAWNAVFFLGKVPVFYTPFIWKSLDKEFLRTRIQPGYDRTNGTYVKTSTFYDIGPWTHGRFLLDEFGHKGIGYGNELDLYRPGWSRGGIFGYAIREKHSGRERWTLLGDDYTVLPSSFAFQMRLQAQSDPNFNNDYHRSNSFIITPQLINNGAFVRNTGKYIARISYSRQDDQNPSLTNRFRKTQEDMPRLDFQSAPLSIGKLPWLNTFSGYADNNFTVDRGYLQRSVQGAWQGKRSLRLFRGVSFEPSAGVSGSYLNRFDDFILNSTRTYQDSYVGRYNGGGDLRVKTFLGTWDLAETYLQRLTPNTMNADSGAVDHGVETHLSTLADTLRPSRNLFARIQSGYDWRNFRDHSVGFRDRVQPFTADVTWSVTPDWALLAHDGYHLNQGNQTVAIQSDWGQRLGNYFGLGVNNNQATASHFITNQDFGVAFSSGTWKLHGVLREDLFDARGGGHFHSIKLFDKELTIQRTGHDFVAKLMLLARPGGVKEASVRFELKLDTKRPVIGPNSRAETPWRTWKSDE